jgi:hypothetical protein
MKFYVKYLFNKSLSENGSSLALSIALLLIVSTFISIYLITFRTTMSVVKNEIQYYRASVNAYSGINYAKNMEELRNLHGQINIEHEDLKFKIDRYLIGFSEEIYSTGYYQNYQVTRFANVLVHNSSYDNLAIITGGRAFNNPVYVTAGTDITGNVLTGKYGFSKQSIRNLYFKGKEIVKGKIYKEQKSYAPALDYFAIEKILSSERTLIEVKDSIFNLNFQSYRFSGILPRKIIGPGTIEINGDLSDLEEISHSNIIVSSDIEIPKELLINDCMIFSKGKISVEGKRENLQLVSEKMIKLKASAELTGHSLLLVIGNSSQVKSRIPAIFLEEGSRFNGAIIYKEPKDFHYRDHYLPFDFKNKSKFKGIIYSPYGVSTELSLDGLIIINYTEFKLGGSTYQNYLKDLKIKAEEKYITLNLFPYTERLIEKTYEL